MRSYLFWKKFISCTPFTSFFITNKLNETQECFSTINTHIIMFSVFFYQLFMGLVKPWKLWGSALFYFFSIILLSEITIMIGLIGFIGLKVFRLRVYILRTGVYLHFHHLLVQVLRNCFLLHPALYRHIHSKILERTQFFFLLSLKY